MSDLQFSHTNIAMATHETTGRTILWDRDTDTFGSGYDLPEALKDLASNYNPEYRVEVGDISEEQIQEFKQRFEELER